MFRLLRYFSVTSAIAVVITASVLVMAYRQGIISEIIVNAEKENIALTQTIKNTIWPSFSSYLTSISNADGETLRSRPETREVHAALKTLTVGLPVLKVKVYNLNGLTVYSSQASQMGDDKSKNPGFISARNGIAASKLTFRDTFSAFEGEVSDRDLVASYIPVKMSDGTIEAVFELYTDITTTKARIESAMFDLAIIPLVAFGLLYVVLFLLVRKADTILKQQYADQQLAEEHMRSLVDNAADGIFVHDFAGQIIEANQAACRNLAYSKKKLQTMTIADIVSNFNEERYLNLWKNMTPGDTVTIEDCHRRRDGSDFPVETRLGFYQTGNRPLMVSLVRDITERKEAEKAIMHAATHDDLTGLPNRALMVDRLLLALAKFHRSKTMAALLFIDLDSFKDVNDTFGHNSGDDLLKKVSERFLSAVRDVDTVSRFGGDEFAILLMDVPNMASVRVVAHKLLGALSEPFTIDGNTVSIGGSIGIALCPDDGVESERLFKQADEAMYRAKQAGKNDFRFASEDAV